jgi:hypothetical protein
MKGLFEGLQTAPIAEIAPGYGLEVLGPHVRRQEVDKRCLENVIFLRFLVLVEADIGASAGMEGNMGRSGQIGGGGKRGVLM